MKTYEQMRAAQLKKDIEGLNIFISLLSAPPVSGNDAAKIKKLMKERRSKSAALRRFEGEGAHVEA